MRYLLLIYLIGLMGISGCRVSKPIVPAPAPVQPKSVLTETEKLPADPAVTSPFLDQLLSRQPWLDSLKKKRKELNIQIVYTQIDRGINGLPAFTHHFYNLNDSSYFYPASTVKLPVCILALQKLGELADKGIDKNTTMITEVGYSGQTPAYNEPTHPEGKPNIAQYIKKILLVSDNEAYNRLYEFLGQTYIRSQLSTRKYPMAEIVHRLSVPLSEDENRHTNPIKFLSGSGKLLYEQPMQYNSMAYPIRSDVVGKGYYSGKELVNRPMDFSKKNRLPLLDLHRMVMSVVFPNAVRAEERFNITPDDRRFLLKYMSQLPGESVFPSYAEDSAYYPAYCKFLLFGSEKGPWPNNIRVFNKVGDAYGQLTDAAYVVDFDHHVEFLLSATIYCNADGVLNDDHYDYETIGFPFMKKLGELIYQHELKRSRKVLPDLSEFQFSYDRKLN